MKYITQSMPSTTWVAFNRSRICSTSRKTFTLTLTSLIDQQKIPPIDGGYIKV
jgi:hypothetical protein